jgi:hypothetical protein
VTYAQTLATATMAALLLTACGGASTTAEEPEASTEDVEVTEEAEEPEAAAYSEECGQAVADAAAVGDMEDTVEDLDPAIITCDGLEQLRAATDDHPGALDGVDLETFVANRCLYSEDEAVAGSSTCDEVDAA